MSPRPLPARAPAPAPSCPTRPRRTRRERVRRGRRRKTRARSGPFPSRRHTSTMGPGSIPAPSLYGVIKSKGSRPQTGVGERTLSMARVDLVRSGAQRVALAATGIVAALYLLIAVAVVLIVTHNLTSNVDTTLSSWLTSMAKQRGGPTRVNPGGPPGGPRFEAPVLWWTFHPDGNYADSSAEAANINLPAPYNRIQSPQTITVSARDLLWLARCEGMPPSARAEPVDRGVMAQQAVDRFAALAEARHQRLSIRLSGDSHVIAASPEWLDRRVGVLLDNACKYTPEQGAIDVRVAAEGNRIKLVVDDSGPGIPADQRGEIFDRFRRATDQPGGAGLGLAIADAVVRATNGRWEVGTSTARGARMAGG